MMGDAKDSSSPLPPLRIHHFLAWMTVAGVTIAAARALIGKDYFLALSNGTPLFFFEYLIASLATTVCGFVLYWRFRVNGFAWEPGHGLLLQQAANLVLRMVGSTLFALYVGKGVLTGVGTALSVTPSFVQWFFEWQPDSYDVLNAAVFLFSALAIVPRGAWRALFSLLTVFAAVSLAWTGLLLPSLTYSGLERAESVSNGVFYLPRILAVIFLVALSVRDKRVGANHHWSHWCGVGCFLVSTLISLGQYLVSA